MTCEERERDREKKARERKGRVTKKVTGWQTARGRGTRVEGPWDSAFQCSVFVPHPLLSEKTGCKVSSAPGCINIWPKTPLHREEGFGLGRPLSVPFDL